MYTSTAYEIQKAKNNGSGNTYEKGQRLGLNEWNAAKTPEPKIGNGDIVENHWEDLCFVVLC